MTRDQWLAHLAPLADPATLRGGIRRELYRKPRGERLGVCCPHVPIGHLRGRRWPDDDTPARVVLGLYAGDQLAARENDLLWRDLIAGPEEDHASVMLDLREPAALPDGGGR